jgi:hypothetical protein
MNINDVKHRAFERDINYKAGRDFNQKVYIRHLDGSIFYFKYAKIIYDDVYIVVHTEHNDIHVFNQYDVENHEYEPMWK